MIFRTTQNLLTTTATLQWANRAAWVRIRRQEAEDKKGRIFT